MNTPPPHVNWKQVSDLVLSLNSQDAVTGSSGASPAALVTSPGYPPDVTLFRQGAQPQQVFFIERGLVKLNRVEQDGQQIIVGLRSSGWILGASEVILQKFSPVSATTLTDCNIRMISAEAFRHLLKTDVQFSWHIQYSQSRETHEHITRIAQLSCMSARNRLEELLSGLISGMGLTATKKEVRVEVPLKQWEIAQLIGVTPEHLCRMLRALEGEGVICRKKGWLIVNDAQKLRRSADS